MHGLQRGAERERGVGYKLSRAEYESEGEGDGRDWEEIVPEAGVLARNIPVEEFLICRE